MSTVFEFTYADGPVIARVEAANEREARAHLRETITARKLPVVEVIGLAQSGTAIVSAETGQEIGRAHVCTPVTNAHIVCRLLLDKTQNLLSLRHLYSSTVP